MRIEDIHWHDSVLRKVVELPAEDKCQLLFEVDYPIDWESDVYEISTICFSNLHTYKIHEGAFYGAPTLLDANEIVKENEFGIRTIQIETNAGHRVVCCGFVSLIKGEIKL